jgi:hypothetical protein
MSDEEILSAVREVYQPIEADSDLADCIRSIVSQAYERAALLADRHQDKCATGDRFYCPREIANEIRALKSER